MTDKQEQNNRAYQMAARFYREHTDPQLIEDMMELMDEYYKARYLIHIAISECAEIELRIEALINRHL